MSRPFPPLRSQRQIDSTATAQTRSLPQLPSLPWSEWMLAAILLMVLAAA